MKSGARLVPLCPVVAAVLIALAAGPGRPAAADDSELRCLALTIYWEARQDGRDGMVAVAWVVLNRRRSEAFPSTVCAVVRQGGETPPCQFSYWCDGEPDVPENEESWAVARQVARDVLSKPPPDPTKGALFFHSADIPVPWTVTRERTVRVGRHIFYR